MIVIFIGLQIIIWPCPNGFKYAKDDRQYVTSGL